MLRHQKPEGQPAEKNARKPILKVRVFCVRQGCISFFFHSTNLGFGLLVGLSALFVFVMVVVVIFAYMASDARGERLGVPGFEGTLIFLALLQVPVVLFQRKPDMLD